MTTQTSHDIHGIAAQFDRLCPSQVDATPRDWGERREAGHIGHEHDDYGIVGWYCAAGSTGHAVARVPHDAIDDLYDRLAALPDGALDDGGIEDIVEECGGKWIA